MIPNGSLFFEKNYKLPSATQIVQLNRTMIPFLEASEVRTFAGFKETFFGKQFDFIIIDAPQGGDMPQYARIDILQLLPNCLKKDFVILLDDYNRSGENHTAKLMEQKLTEAGIACRSGVYRGEKDVFVLASESLKFTVSM